jgi:ATP-dependent helicase HrpA
MLISYPPDLPITARKDDIVRAIRENQVLVLAGETGSGKTTQIPKMCLEALGSANAATGAKRPLIGCTQPRRVAALSIARRLAQELGVQYGREVGSKIRFSDETSRETQIKVMTDGILLAETQGDPDLRAYSCLIIDEAHEDILSCSSRAARI